QRPPEVRSVEPPPLGAVLAAPPPPAGLAPRPPPATVAVGSRLPPPDPPTAPPPARGAGLRRPPPGASFAPHLDQDVPGPARQARHLRRGCPRLADVPRVDRAEHRPDDPAPRGGDDRLQAVAVDPAVVRRARPTRLAVDPLGPLAAGPLRLVPG